MIEIGKVSDIFCLVDEFCKDFRQTTSPFIIGKQPKRPLEMSEGEVITICLLFNMSGFRYIKHFYLFYVQKQ